MASLKLKKKYFYIDFHYKNDVLSFCLKIQKCSKVPSFSPGTRFTKSNPPYIQWQLVQEHSSILFSTLQFLLLIEYHILIQLIEMNIFYCIYSLVELLFVRKVSKVPENGKRKRLRHGQILTHTLFNQFLGQNNAIITIIDYLYIGPFRP